MATPQATKRLQKDYQAIIKQPVPYISAHPSESNILEWHYILTGPPQTPYEGGQYWGTLQFPPDYPFAPPAIRMHTPSGRFQPSTRLCLSISDFHPKSFNPAWGVSTILVGLMSFMTSEEMTTGSVRANEAERRLFAARTRWWNSTGGGSSNRIIPGVSPEQEATARSGSNNGGNGLAGIGAVKAGDGGAKFRKEFPELDEQNWKWMTEKRIDPKTGYVVSSSAAGPGPCNSTAAALRRRPGSSTSGLGAMVEGGQAARQAGQVGGGWVARNKWKIGLVVVFGYVILARLLGDGTTDSS
ncbi:putative ubiquitin-conjugating enzyme Ubc6 [Eremomyces bilateralis CBS 781.70]|uniref:Ubiquitin-conjugating enzyme Ubc6 n=1 Tax=Eremomyces bilateralis CBS 781.70 TaxID=1392243 RepID=A0A6G1G4V3_9PEZI|nr:putative ubiquitin-conjugating enzyme Ubc6 [Eremomyces bilateralis CBS 781.70]KAF1813048.1 putative ubiquitin-conjugating enzyme Ubc6 [Eremomyces bilateralis CBS 781.70]